MIRRLPLVLVLAGALATAPAALGARAIPDAGLRINAGPSGDVCREARLAKDAGIPWVYMDTTWQGLEQTPDANRDPNSSSARTLGWAVQLASCAKGLGLQVALNITNPPSWASGTTAAADHPTAANVPAYGELLREVVPALAPYVDAYVPWNEPNFDLQWSPPHDAALYVKIQRTAYTAIKEKDPTAIVSSAPIVGTSTSSATPAWDYLEAMYANGLKGYADVIGFNFYPRTPPEAIVTDSRGRPAAWALSSQPYLRALVDRYDPGRPIWIEETSHSTCVNCNVSGANAVSEATQADYLVRMYTYRRRYLQGVTDKIFWYNARDLSADRSDWFANQGLVRFDWSPKPAYGALAQLLVDVPDTPSGGGGGTPGPAAGGGAETPPIAVPSLPVAAAKPPLPATGRTRAGVRVRLSKPVLRVSRGRFRLTVTATISQGRGVLRVEGYRARRWRPVKVVALPGSARVRLTIADKGYLGLRVLLRPAATRRFVASRVVRIPGTPLATPRARARTATRR